MKQSKKSLGLGDDRESVGVRISRSYATFFWAGSSDLVLGRQMHLLCARSTTKSMNVRCLSLASGFLSTCAGFALGTASERVAETVRKGMLEQAGDMT